MWKWTMRGRDYKDEEKDDEEKNEEEDKEGDEVDQEGQKDDAYPQVEEEGWVGGEKEKICFSKQYLLQY